MAKPISKPHKSKPGQFAIAILAAGKGTRLKSRHPKVLHQIAGKPLLAHVVAAASKVVAPQNIFAIVGHEAERAKEALASSGINFILQREQRGTGHAMMEARAALQSFDTVLVLSGDVPLIQAATIKRVRDFHNARHPAMTMLTAEPADPTGYGRVFRKKIKVRESDEVERIVEQKDASPGEMRIDEGNAGIDCVSATFLRQAVKALTTDNAQGELYLTDVAAAAARLPAGVATIEAAPEQVLGVNDRVPPATVDEILRRRILAAHARAGVTIRSDPVSFSSTRHRGWQGQ